MKKPYVIGIAGGSASGKSTFCSKLEAKLSMFSVKVFHMDDYDVCVYSARFAVKKILGKTLFFERINMNGQIKSLPKCIFSCFGRLFHIKISENSQAGEANLRNNFLRRFF